MSKNYYLQNIRLLLTEGFTDGELRRLCYDVPHFRPVYEQLAQDTGKARIIDRLLEHAEQKVLIDTLLELAKELNSARYEQHQPYHKVLSSEPVKEPPSESGSGKIQREVQGDGNSSFSAPGREPYLVNPKRLLLPAHLEIVLKQMFAGYERVVIEREFGGGFSGGRVFMLRPIRNEKRPELPAVVKIASVSLIKKEREAYQDYIQDRLPNAIGIRNLVLPPDSDWAGLRYPLMGGGTFAFQSLWDYCRAAAVEDVRSVLEERLLKAVEALLQVNRVRPAFSLQASYDPLLPLNLLIQPGALPTRSNAVLLTPETLPDAPLKQGDYVRLEGFIVIKVDLVDGTVSLNVPTSPDSPASYSLRLKSVGGLASYQADQIIEPIEGVVLETRQEKLEAEARRVLGASFNPASEILTMPDGTKLPNPLLKLPDILSQLPNVRVGTIHGDLNMENVLVDPATRDIHLIDFASAREGHVLHDFLRLETEVMVKLVAELLAQANLGAGMIRPFYEQLHQVVVNSHPFVANDLPDARLVKPFTMLVVIRKAARPYFFKWDDWSEYYQGLVVYLLGALKFANLEPLSKQVAFWGAGGVGGIPVEPVRASIPPVNESPSSSETIATHGETIGGSGGITIGGSGHHIEGGIHLTNLKK